MIIKREDIEKREYQILSPFAAKVAESKGRVYQEEKDEIRTDFQRDRDRIIHSKAFRRLMHKTQVFLAPEGDHFRTRLTHTIEVSQIARTIARGLGLNEDLTEAIAMGHDLGHTPFGHNGEMVLNKIYPKGFKHNVQSLRVVDVLEEGRDFPGMNLTFEVRDGILNHTGSVKPATLEGQIVKISDRIAYINHDIDDAIRSEVITASDLPKDCTDILGKTHKERIDFLVWDMIINSDGQDEIKMSEKALNAMNALRAYMFDNVYNNPTVKTHSQLEYVKKIITTFYDYYTKHPEELLENTFKGDISKLDKETIEEEVKDYIAGMTDRFAMRHFEEKFGDDSLKSPKSW